VVRAHGGEAPSDDRRAQPPDRGFHFGELGHAVVGGSWSVRRGAATGPAQVRCAATPRAYVTRSPGSGSPRWRSSGRSSTNTSSTSSTPRDVQGLVPRSALLALGDEAVAALGAQAQTTLTEMVLWGWLGVCGWC
jgi:hypothetical protein